MENNLYGSRVVYIGIWNVVHIFVFVNSVRITEVTVICTLGRELENGPLIWSIGTDA
jgi:hypothetical protein